MSRPTRSTMNPPPKLHVLDAKPTAHVGHVSTGAVDPGSLTPCVCAPSRTQATLRRRTQRRAEVYRMFVVEPSRGSFGARSHA